MEWDGFPVVHVGCITRSIRKCNFRLFFTDLTKTKIQSGSKMHPRTSCSPCFCNFNSLLFRSSKRPCLNHQYNRICFNIIAYHIQLQNVLQVFKIIIAMLEIPLVTLCLILMQKIPVDVNFCTSYRFLYLTTWTNIDVIVCLFSFPLSYYLYLPI